MPLHTIEEHKLQKSIQILSHIEKKQNKNAKHLLYIMLNNILILKDYLIQEALIGRLAEVLWKDKHNI